MFNNSTRTTRKDTPLRIRSTVPCEQGSVSTVCVIRISSITSRLLYFSKSTAMIAVVKIDLCIQ